MTGITVDATPTVSRSFHAISSCSGSAMSAIEQPAARSGRITCWCGAAEDVRALGHEVDAAEDDELGVLVLADALRELPRVAGVVGELDHLVALVVVAEHDETLAERRPRRRDPAVHLLDRQAEVALRERLPLADVLVLVLRQDVDVPMDRSDAAATPGLAPARAADDSGSRRCELATRL